MFSGIVEATSRVLSSKLLDHAVTVHVERPSDFQDLKIGDSVACNGVCLTIEGFDEHQLQFTLAAETLRLLQLDPQALVGQIWNLERSLKFGDRVHGHLVTGHIEALGRVVFSEALGDSWILRVQVPSSLRRYLWAKGSVALHGVSLTVNHFEADTVEVCLIPETLKRTNLRSLSVGSPVNLETDYLAKAYFQGRDHGLS
ncbi:MAG: riboflavin synthase [Bdellovibrionales bacterium]